MELSCPGGMRSLSELARDSAWDGRRLDGGHCGGLCVYCMLLCDSVLL